MKIKKVVLISVLVLLLLIIFIFSGQDGNTSINTSDAFASRVIDKIADITAKDLTPTRKKQLVIKTRYIVRKIAHFTLYFILGAIIYLIVSSRISSYKIAFIVSIGLCVLLASLDEIHQLFTVGRTAQVYDVFIDTLGSGTGIAIVSIIKYILKRKLPSAKFDKTA